MRNLMTSALAALALAGMLAMPLGAQAQTRRSGSSSSAGRSTSTTSGSSSSSNRSSAVRSSSSSSQTRSSSSSAVRSSSSSQTRSSATQVTRQSNTGRSTSTGSATRSSSTSSQTRSSSSSAVRSSSSSSATRSATAPTQSSQVRRGTTTSGSSSTGSATRSSSTSSQTRSSSATRSSATSGSQQAVRSSSSAATASPSSSNSQQVRRSSTSASSGSVAANNNVTRRGLSPVTQEMQSKSSNAPANNNYGDYRVDNHNVQRIPPRERDFMTYDRPGAFWGRDPHYFGWRIQTLPPRYRRVRYFGIDYYFYNNVYYRPYAGHYVICRPPFGVVIEIAPRRVSLATVAFAYYHNVYRTYNGWDSYSRYIDEQNRIIAQNNATIAAQNAAIAMNLNAAQNSYSIANQLGLAQSYAYANQQYYYEDGVFYIINRKGSYEVIVPPAGALVETLPEDYETLTLGGHEYYRVDDTVYRMVMVQGRPYLEVLGQMYGDMARRYNTYYQYY
ncbi:MAG: hypothetical protein IJ578_09600 [Bacteroidales bacterium]|nr:hypothetical protein [Bacteroidales bacterium]